ncbi:YIEGIA family protein [Anaeromicrobium sediminis]|nr:YIEGIA family protein [Anaeromicrobium sediminis]
MHDFIVSMLPSFMMGILARIYMIRIDQRQYPSYPQGLISHFTLGIIAAFLGAVALPALVEKEFGAVTFLAVAAQQFRDVRSMERESLDNIEPTELVQRGTAYIEDIAKAFEARNYMVILTSLSTSLTIYCVKIIYSNIYVEFIVGICVGTIVMLFLKFLLMRQSIRQIGEVRSAKMVFDGPILLVDDVVITNVGLDATKDFYLKYGLAAEIIPRDEDAIETLANVGQSQTILHNIYVQLGIKRDSDDVEYAPFAKRNLETGSMIIICIPLIKDEKLLLESIQGTPILETAKRKTLYRNSFKKMS